MINGEAKGFFKDEKGLRQGDPLSSGVFTLIMDVLLFMISRLKDAGLIEGFHMNEDNNSGEVTHLLFADDTLLFCDVCHDQVVKLLATLVCFQVVTGLKINLDKSFMICNTLGKSYIDKARESFMVHK
ncbi:unnamed protein product [Linum trigynum]|uniref:Reverse transcriptase domain-containing protein n=1 Tax=Linum trigynum TaxID=586398 RepID=A0AAV2E8V8_9ROSI